MVENADTELGFNSIEGNDDDDDGDDDDGEGEETTTRRKKIRVLLTRYVFQKLNPTHSNRALFAGGNCIRF